MPLLQLTLVLQLPELNNYVERKATEKQAVQFMCNLNIKCLSFHIK